MARDDDLAAMPPDLRAQLARERDLWEAAILESERRFRADTLVGLRVDRARALVEAPGGEFVTDQEPLATKLDSNRVVAEVDDGRVVDTHIG